MRHRRDRPLDHRRLCGSRTRCRTPRGDRGDDPLTHIARHTLVHPDGRYLHIYGELRGTLEAASRDRDESSIHLRKDLLTDEWVAVSPSRNVRPHTDDPSHVDEVPCPLCPGGAEVPFSYDAAVFENRWPSFLQHPPSPEEEGLVEPAGGRCEVVLYTENHEGSFATLDPTEVGRVLAVWRDRSEELWGEHEAVMIFENRGDEVGSTIAHPHGQIYAFDHIPPMMQKRIETARGFRDRTNGCLGCKLVESTPEAEGRSVGKNDSFSIAVPFAARWPFEVHVRARRHDLSRLSDLDPTEAVDLARALQELTMRYDLLYGFDLPYMMVVHEAPHGVNDWHLSVEFYPPHRAPDKLKIRAAVETAAGIFINDTIPESSAAILAGLSVPDREWPEGIVPSVSRQDEKGDGE